MTSRKKVKIPDKALLEALKFLMGPQWQKMRFVSHQLAQVVQRNIADLPSIAMESASFKILEKFRTIATIENEIPSIWFSSRKNQGERVQLNSFLMDPGVTKLEPRDSHNAEAVYIVSNGRNRMQIEIFKRLDFEEERGIYDNQYDKDAQQLSISADSSKSDDVYHVIIKFSTIEGPMSKKVEIIDDSWIEALKFLPFAQWSKTLFVSCKVSGLVQKNVAHLPRIVIDRATISWANHLIKTRGYVTAFGDKYLSEEFFTELGISLDAPADVQHKNVFISLRDEILPQENAKSESKFELCFVGELAGHRVANETIFFAQFGKSLPYSWVAIKYFLKFLYHPASYVKEVEIFAINQKLIDFCFGGAKRFIRCGLFSWTGGIATMTADDFSESLSWMEKNIRAETIQFPKYIDTIKENQFYDQIGIFLLRSSWMCASKEVKFKWICDMNRFLEALVKKFRSVSFVQNDTPTFKAAGYSDAKPLRCLLPGPNVKKLNSEDSQDADVYVIYNGDSRMQIKIFKRRNFETDDSDSSEEDEDYNDGYEEEEKMFDVYVKVYQV